MKSAIKECTCKSEYQDKVYGKNMRVMNPMAKIVAGYPAAMPAYAGRINEEQMGALVEYIRSIK
jgi:mono/diheme cytochrome c family protein